jgi:DNA-binding MarR family transcriptional regulator
MRQRFLALTRTGERALARSLPAWRKVQERLVSTVGAEQWNDLRSKLEELAHTVVALDGPSGDPLSSKPASS